MAVFSPQSNKSTNNPIHWREIVKVFSTYQYTPYVLTFCRDIVQPYCGMFAQT